MIRCPECRKAEVSDYAELVEHLRDDHNLVLAEEVVRALLGEERHEHAYTQMVILEGIGWAVACAMCDEIDPEWLKDWQAYHKEKYG